MSISLQFSLKGALGQVAPNALAAARAQLHWAAQISGAVGNSQLQPQDDDTHTTLEWLPEHQVLATRLLGVTYRLGLHIADASLVLLDQEASMLSRLALQGQTLEAAYKWAEESITALHHEALAQPLRGREYDIPDHPVKSEGATFDFPDSAACAELSRWYEAAAEALGLLAGTLEEASIVRCWPHHFDIAVLVRFDPDKDPEQARSVNIGLSPGDGSYAEPYWYVVPWPHPGADDLPDLPLGHWHKENWLGAILTDSVLTCKATEAGVQAQAVSAFLVNAYASAQDLLMD